MTTIGQCQALKLIKEDQECGSFTKWQIGLTPQEHLQMHMLEEQRKANAQMLADQKTANDDLLTRQLTSNEEIAKKARLTALFAALIGIGAALAGSAMMYLLTRTS